MKKVLNIFAFAVIAILSFNIATAQDYNVQTEQYSQTALDLRCEISAISGNDDCFPVKVNRIVSIPQYPDCKIEVEAYYTFCNGKCYVQIMSYSVIGDACDVLRKKLIDVDNIYDFHKWFDNQLLYALMIQIFEEAREKQPDDYYYCPKTKKVFVGIMVPCEAYWVYETDYNPWCPECSCPKRIKVAKSRCVTEACCEYEVKLCYNTKTKKVEVQGDVWGSPISHNCAAGYPIMPDFGIPPGYYFKVLGVTRCFASCKNPYPYNSPEPTGK